MSPLYWNCIYHLHAQRTVYFNITKKKRQQTDQMDAVAFGGLQKTNIKEVTCSNCLPWYLDFSENKSSSSPAVERPSPIEAGVLCTGPLLKSSPLPFLDFRSLNGAKLAFWEGGKVLLTSVLKRLWFCGKTYHVACFMWEVEPCLWEAVILGAIRVFWGLPTIWL